jgi:UDP-N-acetylmuramate dehydrogenase
MKNYQVLRKMRSEMELLKKIKGKVLFDVTMRNHTTFHIGGPADILVVPKDLDDIKYSVTYAKKERIPLHVIGNGSKILVSDKGIRGIVIKIAKTLDDAKVSGELIAAGAGCSLSKLIRIATDNNLSGIEFTAGIPGTLGGAIAMNAGTYLGSMSDITERVTVLNPTDGSQSVLSKDDCHFGYRESAFQKKRLVILEVEMRLKKSDHKEIEEKIIGLLERRKTTQPPEKHSAGCIFKNPSAMPAGKLIDTVGLKGSRKGDAKIPEVHGNFIVNLGKAKAIDVFFLMGLAQEKVKESFGIKLQPEIILMGNFE